MKVALVYDRVNKFGGAERLVSLLHKVFPEAPLYTLVHDETSAVWAKNIKVIPTFLNSIPSLRKKHELLAPIAPLAFETLDFSEFDVVVSITSSDAKAIITGPKQLHVCYCLTPTRYFWSGENEYKKDIKMKLLPKFVHNYFRTIDLLTSARPDEYIAISEEVKNRIKKYYNRNSPVIYPAIDDKFYSGKPLPQNKRGYYLLVSRLVPYKKTDIAVEAFNKLKKKLIIVGEGSESSRLKKLAGKNISFTGKINDEELIDYYCGAKALIFPQDEDFGLVPIEAQASGTPVIAYGRGGALETVIQDKTGLYFPEQTAESLIAAVKIFEKMNISSQACVDNAQKFSTKNFYHQMEQSVANLWDKFSKI